MTTIESGCRFVIFTLMYGIIREYFIFNGKKEGEYKQYDNSGKSSVICNYKNGNLEGEYKQYHENGKLCIICNYKNGKKEGEYKTYWPNGQLVRICNYKNEKKIEI